MENTTKNTYNILERVICDRKFGTVSRLLDVNRGIVFWFPVYIRDFYFPRSAHTDSEAHRPLHQYKMPFHYSRVNWQRRETDHLVPKFRMSGAISPFPLTPSSRAHQELQFSLSLRTIDHFRKQGNTIALIPVIARSSNPTCVILASQCSGYLVFLPV